MRIRTIALTALFVAFFAMVGQTALAGFGVSPPSLQNKNLVPGSYYEQVIYLVQATPDKTLHATVKVDAGKINKWITIENGDTFDIPRGSQQFPMKIAVAVPADAAYGEYKGTITVNTVPEGATSGVQVTLGAEIAVDLTVSSLKVSSFSIQSFKIPDATKGSPIDLVIKVKNEGNINDGPTKASLVFYDQYHNKQLGQAEQNITDKVRSFSTKDLTVSFPNSLDVGQYWADVKIFSGDQAIITSKVVFNVVPPITQRLAKIFSQLPWWGYVILAVIILLIAGAVAFILKNKKKIGGGNTEGPAKIKISDKTDKTNKTGL